MTKHLRSLHATTISTIPRTAVAPSPSTSSQPDKPLSTLDAKKRIPEAKKQAKGKLRPLDTELMEDEDLVDRVAPIRGREPFWATSESDLRAVEAIRKRHPHKNPNYFKGKLQPAGDDSDDSFDEQVSGRYPVKPTLIDEIPDPETPERNMAVLSRPRWQVKYMMAKAKFMLVTEENSMRREELRALIREEAELLEVQRV
jgi:hypothetical protein